MNKRVMMENAMKSLEIKIILIYLKNSGWTQEVCEWKEFIRENYDDYQEYRAWYMTCCA